MDGNEGAPAAEKAERVFFIIDNSKLKKEDDQIANAKLVFRPEEKYLKYEQLCSQLIGLSACTMTLTGQYPQYLKLRNSGYAIKALGKECIMGLSTRAEEPVSSAVQALKLIHDLFVFFYHSPELVKKQAGGATQWEAICTTMVTIFNNILSHVEQDSRKISSMLKSLPFGKYTIQSSIEARFFLLSTRLLRHCQQLQPSINLGCIFHRNKIFCNHLPNTLTEKLLLLVYTNADEHVNIERNIRPLFAEEISGHVWMVPVYLLLTEDQELKTYQRSTQDHSAVYSSLKSSAECQSVFSGASFFTRFTSANPPRASNNSAHSRAQGSPPTHFSRKTTVRRSNDADRTYEDVSDSPEVMKIMKQKSVESVPPSQTPTGAPPSLPPRTKPTAEGGGATPSSAKGQVGGVQPLATSTPGVGAVTPRRSSSSSHGPLVASSSSSGTSSTANTPRGAPVMNATAYYSPNESFSQVGGEPVTPVGGALKDPPHNRPLPSRASLPQVDADDDFMDSSAIEDLIQSKAKGRDRSFSEAPPPLPPRMLDSDYAEADAFPAYDNKKATAGDREATAVKERDCAAVGAETEKPPIPPRQASLVSDVPPETDEPPIPPRQASLVSDVPPETDEPPIPPRQASLVSDVPPETDEPPIPPRQASLVSDVPPETSHPELVAAPPQSSGTDSTGSTHDHVGGECSDVEGEGSVGYSLAVGRGEGGARDEVAVAGWDVAPPNVEASSNPNDQVQEPDSNNTVVTFPGYPPLDAVAIQLEPKDAEENAPTWSDVTSPPEEPRGGALVPQQVSLDMEDKRTGAEDGDAYRSPLGSDCEDEYVPSWALDNNRQWGMADGTGPSEKGVLNEKEELRIKMEGEDEGPAAKEDDDDDFAKVVEEEEDIGMSAAHKAQPPAAHVMRPAIQRTEEEGCSMPMVRKLLFLQNYMDTTVVLLADEGLENEQEQLRELLTTLLAYQSSIEDMLTQHCSVSSEEVLASRAMYRSVDRKCETVGNFGHTQFRHALRRAHQEYQNDPSLLQVTMSKESRTTLSKCVLGREVYIHCKRTNTTEDALQTLPAVEKFVRGGKGSGKDEDGSELHGLFL